MWSDFIVMNMILTHFALLKERAMGGGEVI